MVQGLTPGAEIKNKAEIYFDSNPAIVTNYALNTIETISTSIEDFTKEGLKVSVYPNPMKNFVVFDMSELTSKEQLEISIYDISGKRVLVNSVNDQELVKITKADLSSGIYIYQVISLETNNSINGKLIVE
jgi:hypothetical protein